MNKEEELIDRLIDLAFAEDIGDGDHTTLSCIPATAMGKSKLLIKEAGILAGIEVAKEVFRRFDPTMKVEVFINDGTEVKPGDVAMVVEGKVQSLLQTERLMLNIMQRMSGIATMTHKYAEKLKGTNTRVLDTRKTTPGMRILEKMAVKIGGGVNHRIGLFDMILLKDNHVDFAGGIDKAITRAKEYCKEKGKDLKIEIEVRNFDELQQVLDLGGVDRIMFDNFTPEMTKKAVEMVAGRYETESSGGITFDTLRDYAECGVDFISVGALTHSVKGLDMSFKVLRLTNKRREEASVKRALTLENEIELIEGCRAGKDSARKELYTLYSKQMLAVCYRYTGDMDAAHDVLHDGFIKIFTRFTFRGECALGTWVTRVMVTQAIDYLRRKHRFSQLVVNEEQLPDVQDEASIAESGSGLSEEVLMAFVAELPDGCRTVFNLYVFEEKSHKEIAELLHIKEHSSTSQLHRAKCMLAKRIKEYTEYERKR